MPKYEVQHWTFIEGWVNTWTTYSNTLESEPTVFDSIAAAQQELDEFFEDIDEDIKEGNRQPDEGYSRDEFRIVLVGQGTDEDCDDYSRKETPVAKSAKELWDEIFEYLCEMEQSSFDCHVEDGCDPDNHILGKAIEFSSLFNHKLESNKVEEEDDPNRCA